MPKGIYGLYRGVKAACHPDRRNKGGGLCVECYPKAHRRTKEKERRSNLKTSYGITPEYYTKLFEAQNGRCIICRSDKTHASNKANFPIDHCHDCGVIRGLTCNRCNAGMGNLQDDPELLRKAADYLEKHLKEHSS